MRPRILRASLSQAHRPTTPSPATPVAHPSPPEPTARSTFHSIPRRRAHATLSSTWPTTAAARPPRPSPAPDSELEARGANAIRIKARLHRLQQKPNLTPTGLGKNRYSTPSPQKASDFEGFCGIAKATP